jgi:hypothetical protein
MRKTIYLCIGVSVTSHEEKELMSKLRIKYIVDNVQRLSYDNKTPQEYCL